MTHLINRRCVDTFPRSQNRQVLGSTQKCDVIDHDRIRRDLTESRSMEYYAATSLEKLQTAFRTETATGFGQRLRDAGVGLVPGRLRPSLLAQTATQDLAAPLLDV